MRKISLFVNYKKVHREFPEKWDELTENQLLFFCRKKIKLKDEMLRVSVAYQFLNVPPRYFFPLRKGQLLEITGLLDFLFAECDLSKFLIKSLRLPGKFKKYYSPGDQLKWSTVGEVAYADSHLQAYLSSGSDDDLCMLAASLYRPTNPVRLFGHIVFGGDIRCKFNDNTLKRRAKKFKKLPAYMKHAIMLQYQGCRTVDVRNNPEIYNSSGETSPFGWAGLIKGLANSDIAKTEIAENMLWNNAQVFLKMLEHDRKQLEKLYKTD